MKAPIAVVVFLLLLLPLSLASSSSFTFVQITDLHVDSRYLAGSYSNCTAVDLCCHDDSAPLGNETAGIEGDYFCDSPWSILISSFEFIASIKPPPKFLLYSGDVVPHDTFHLTNDGVIDYVRNFTALVKKYIPSIPMFPMIGNHDTHPLDQLPPPKEAAWLFDPLSTIWKDYIPESSRASFKYGGYYTALVPDSNIRLIVLNTLYWDRFNAYTVLNETIEVQQKQLKFLEDILDAAKTAGEYVYIAAHIAPGHYEVMDEYNIAMISALNKYKDIIQGSFFGHTHNDKFRVVLDDKIGEIPTAPLWIAPSITPYQFINPSVRMYVSDTSNSGKIADFIQYYCDLGKANKNKKACTFTVLYRMSEYYGLKNMDAMSMYEMYLKLSTNNTFFQEYYNNSCTGYPNHHACPEKCQCGVLCQIRHTEFQKSRDCMKDCGVTDSIEPLSRDYLDTISALGKVELSATGIRSALDQLLLSIPRNVNQAEKTKRFRDLAYILKSRLFIDTISDERNKEKLYNEWKYQNTPSNVVKDFDYCGPNETF